MYSKRMNSSMIIGLFSLALVFCARENEPYSSPVRYDGQQLIQGSSKSTIKEESECIDNAGAILKRFVRGELSEKQLVGFWNCLDRILNLVNTKVSKPDGKGLTSKELTNLIQFMFKEHRQNIDAELMNEVLVVKQVLVGGQSQYLSEVDLVQLRSLMREFKLITLSLRTKIGVIGTAFFENSQVPNPQQLQPAREYLLDAAHELAVLFSRNKKPYRFNNLKNLIAQIDRLRGKKTLKAESSSLLKYIDLLVGAKALLVGPDKTAIQKNEWSRFFKVVSEALVVWSRYSHYMGKEDSDMTQGTALEQTEAIAHVFAHEVAYALKSRGRPFSHDEIDFLLTAMGRAELKVLNLSTEDLKKLARKAVDRLLVPIGVKDQPGYALMNHKVLIEEFKVWYSIQSLSNNIVDQLQVTQRDQIIALVEKAAQKQPRVRELARVLRGVWPLVVDSKGRPVVQNNLQKGYDQHSLATLNWIRMLVRVFIRSYAEDKERAQKMTGLLYSDRQGEKDKEFSVLFEDLRPFLESEDLIEILKDKNGAPLVPHPFMAKVYRDTALFLPRSNGDHIINYEEGIEYIHYVYAGTKAKNYILESLFPKVNNKGRVLNGDKHIVPCSIQDFTLKKESRTKHRSELTREDVTHINGDQCYRKKFTSYFQRYMEHLPEMVDFFNKMSSQKSQRLASALEFTIRGKPPRLVVPSSEESKKCYAREYEKFNNIEVGDLTEIMVLSSYLENYMQRFDKDKGLKRGTLDLNFLKSKTELMDAMDVIWLHAGKLLGDLFNIPIDAGKKDLDPGLATRVQAELQVLISYLVKTGQIIKLPAKPPESPGDRENPNTDQESAEWQSAWENKRFDVLKVSADRIDLVKALATINQLGEKEVKSCQLTP